MRSSYDGRVTRFLGEPERPRRISPQFVVIFVITVFVGVSGYSIWHGGGTKAVAAKAHDDTRSAAEVPPPVRECQQQVVGDVCYILEEDSCTSDCPAGYEVVEGDPPAIKKPLSAKKVGERTRHPRQKLTRPPASQPPPKATLVPVGAVLPA